MTEAPEPKFKVGDEVTFTNDYGCIYPGKKITGTERWPHSVAPMATRYFYEPTDSPWYSVAERNLSHATETPA